MRPFSVAGLQVPIGYTDNTATLRTEIITTKRVFPFVDMVLLGELAWFGPNVAVAEPLPGGKTEKTMCDIARETGIWLVSGSIYERAGDKIYNTCSVIDPKGEIIARYRKMYPFLPYEDGVASGDSCCVFEVPGVGKFGISICYDMWFPETMREMTFQGAEVILHPSMTYTIDRDAETAISRANAAMHQCYFVDLNVTGVGGGKSGVYGPGGEIIHLASTGREIIVVELDLDQVKRVREIGWHGLGQVIKSYRDAEIRYPVYAEGAKELPAFRALGPMHFHKARKPE